MHLRARGQRDCKRCLPSITRSALFVGGWRELLLHREHQSPFWHMTYTQLLVKHRPQHKLTCQIPKKTRGAVSSLRIAFQHLICNATKRTAGDMGAGAIPDSAEQRQANKSESQNGKRLEKWRTGRQNRRNVIVRPLVWGSGMRPNLVPYNDLWLFCWALAKHSPPAHNNELFSLCYDQEVRVSVWNV